MRAALGAVVALSAGPVFAECVTERAFVLDAFERNGWAVEAEGAFGDDRGTCQLTDLVLVERTLRVEIEALTWRLEGLENLTAATGGLSLTARLDNLRMVPEVEDPWIGYMLAEQNRRNLIDATLEASWDLDTGTVELASLSVDLPGENAVRLGFRVGGMTPGLIAGNVGDLQALSVRHLALEVENRGFADGLILGYLVGTMSGVPGAPETVIAATKAEAIAMVEDLPEALFLDGGKAALARLIADGPVPWGAIVVQLSHEDGLLMSRFTTLALAPDPMAEAALLRAFEGVEIRISYSPAPEPE